MSGMTNAYVHVLILLDAQKRKHANQLCVKCRKNTCTGTALRTVWTVQFVIPRSKKSSKGWRKYKSWMWPTKKWPLLARLLANDDENSLQLDIFTVNRCGKIWYILLVCQVCRTAVNSTYGLKKH